MKSDIGSLLMPLSILGHKNRNVLGKKKVLSTKSTWKEKLI